MPADALGLEPPATTVLLEDAFLAVVQQVLQERRRGPSAGTAAGEPGGAAASGPARLIELRERLELVLMAQERRALRGTRAEARHLVDDACYLMAAVADELLLTSPWPGAAWAAHLLETRRFGTQISGERVFERIDTVLRENDAELAGLYLLALAVGFQGRYRALGPLPAGARDPAALQALRLKLFICRHGRAPDPVHELRATPEAYHAVPANAAMRMLAPVQWWWGALAGVCVVLLALSWWRWDAATSGIQACLADIEGNSAAVLNNQPGQLWKACDALSPGTMRRQR